MADKEVNRISGIDSRIHETQKAAAQQKLARMEAHQVASQEDLETAAEHYSGFNPMAQRRNFEPLHKRAERSPEPQKSTKTEVQKEAELEDSPAIEQIAEDYYQRNPELQKKMLMNLHHQMKPNDTPHQILEKLQKAYSDKALADEAIDFLIEVSETKEEIRAKYILAKETFNAEYGREIRAGRNIHAQARAFSEKGLGTPTGLRDLYREVTGNPRTPNKLFEELVAKFKFSDMKNIIDFILHALGADLKAKGSSISHAELQRLFSEARTMQAILGVFRFFYARMKMIQKQFDRYDLTMPSRINFEVLARILMQLLEERYPSPDKILKLAFALGIAEEIAAQIIIFTQYRDAMRHISPMLFKSERHRQELLMALMETLSDIEDEYNEQQEKEKGEGESEEEK